MKFWFLTILLIFLTSFMIYPTLAQDTVDPTPASESEAIAEEIVDLTSQTAEATVSTVEGFLNNLVQTPHSDVARILLILGGLILLLVGWRIHDVIILIAGFLIGASIAISLVVSDSTLVNIAVLVIGGLIGTALSIFLYYVAIFLIGAYVGIALTGGLAAALSLTPVSALALLIGGIIGGAILLGLSFEFLIVVSALIGAQMLTLGLGLNVIWTLVFAVIGIIIQLALTRALNYTVRRRPRRISLFGRAV